MVYGTMNNGQNKNDRENIKIFGHGTLSGDKLPHPDFGDPSIPDDQNWIYHQIDIARNAPP